MSMKKFVFSMLVFVFTSLSYKASAQANLTTLGFNYSALVRDSVGRAQPLKPVTLRFTLLVGQSGTSVNSPWIETQATTTDAYGFVNVVIGQGSRSGGTSLTFAAVDFTLTNYWILIEVKNTSTGAYDPLAKEALSAVPYAKVAGAVVGGAVPPGTIVAFAGPTTKVPAGWLLCDGALLSNTDSKYIALFNAIGYGWGNSTTDVTQFRIPNGQGVFLRGASNNSTPKYDPDASIRTFMYTGGNTGQNVGSFQQHAFQDHIHYNVTGGGASPSDTDPALNTDINQTLYGHNFVQGTFGGNTWNGFKSRITQNAQVNNAYLDVHFVAHCDATYVDYDDLYYGSIKVGKVAYAGSYITNPLDLSTNSLTYLPYAPKLSSENRPINIAVNYIIKL